MKKKLSIFVVLFSSAMIFMARKSSLPQLEQTTYKPHLPVESLRKEVSEATQSASTLNQKINLQDIETNQTEVVVTTDKNDSYAPVEKENAEIIQDERKLKIDKINAVISANPNEKISDVSSAQFAKEKADYEWGMAYEQKIGSFFKSNSTFSNFSPDSIECRSDNCKVVVSAANDEQVKAISDSVVNTVYNTDGEIIKNVIFAVDKQKNTVNFYFGRTKDGDIISKINY